MTSGSLRIFWALRPPQTVIDAVAEFAGELRRPFDKLGLKVSWVAAEAMHVTLKFLGNVALSDLSPMLLRVQNELQNLAIANPSAPRLVLRGFGAFPKPERPRVLIAEVHGASSEADLEPLHALQSRLESSLEELGHPREERPFHPHLTLGRVREGRPVSGRDLMQIYSNHGHRRFGEAFPIEEVILYESRLGSEGVTYIPLHRLPLPGNQRRTS